MSTYRTGCISASAWSGEWRSNADDLPVDNDEFDVATTALETELCKFSGIVYVRGDNFGDRTQYVEIVKPLQFSTGIVRELQLWVRCPKYSNWRIVIPCGKPADAIMVYPKIVYFGDIEFSGSDFDVKRLMKSLAACRGKQETETGET